MESIRLTNARQNLFQIAEKTVQTNTPIRFVSKKGDVVMLSADDYEALEETIYLLSFSGMRESVERAKNEGIENSLTLEDIGWDIK